MIADIDDAIRAAAIAYLDGLGAQDRPVSRSELESFTFDGRPLRLIGPQRGIWKPSFLDAALSILTTYVAPNAVPPYEDEVGPDGFPRYKWQGSDPNAFDNVALRVAMERRKPLMWFLGVAPALFNAEYPVWLAGEEPDRQQFVVGLDDTLHDAWHPGLSFRSRQDPVRRYAEAIVRVRLHQRPFRDRVLLAYGAQCALCRLRIRRLLEAAHIKEDSDGGEPIVPNGVSMCAIHHKAFDAQVMGIRPDYVVEISREVLLEHDGPTLQHALQGLHHESILLPRRRAEQPSKELLEERYERFRKAG